MSQELRESLDAARSDYVDHARNVTFMIHTKVNEPNYFETFDIISDRYLQSFERYAGSISLIESGYSIGQAAISETEERRSRLAAAFTERPVNLAPTLELAIVGTSGFSAVAHVYEGQPTAAIGSGMIAAACFMGYRYRRNTSITLDIPDHDLNEMYSKLGMAGDTLDRSVWHDYMRAGVLIEKSAVAQTGLLHMRANTYTPFGYLRRGVQKYKSSRRSA